MLKIRIPFGFKMISIDDRLIIYTGKIRIKAEPDFLMNALQNYQEHLTFTQGRTNCTTITFCTTNVILNNQLMDAINNTLADIMHARIDRKYRGIVTPTFNYDNIDDYLPF